MSEVQIQEWQGEEMKLQDRPIPQPPNGTQPALYQFLRQLANTISALIKDISNIVNAGKFTLVQLDTLTAEPDDPYTGMIVYADGVSWNPGAGEGIYGYQAGAWVKL